ncbi:MAG: hypothetical protein JXQ72_16555 [Anaerolineae bacterium]|nr:hypothetical protein [Anaerolineae bacterium]
MPATKVTTDPFSSPPAAPRDPAPAESPDRPDREPSRDPGPHSATPRLIEVGPLVHVDLPVTSFTPVRLSGIRQDTPSARQRALAHALRYRKLARTERAISREHAATIQAVEAALDKAKVARSETIWGEKSRLMTLPERIAHMTGQISKHHDEIDRQAIRHEADKNRWLNTIARLEAELAQAGKSVDDGAIRAELKRMGSPELDRSSVPVQVLIQKLVDRALKAESLVRKLQAVQPPIGAGGPHSDGSGL